MPKLAYTGPEQVRMIKLSDVVDVSEGEDASMIWNRGAFVDVPDNIWEAMQNKGLKSQFRIVTQEELDALTADSIDQTQPDGASGSGSSTGQLDDGSSADDGDPDD